MHNPWISKLFCQVSKPFARTDGFVGISCHRQWSYLLVYNNFLEERVKLCWHRWSWFSVLRAKLCGHGHLCSQPRLLNSNQSCITSTTRGTKRDPSSVRWIRGSPTRLLTHLRFLDSVLDWDVHFILMEGMNPAPLLPRHCLHQPKHWLLRN